MSTFDERFDDLARLAHRVAFRVLGSRVEAEDVAQEAMARAFARWSRVEDHADAWVGRVATNLAIGVWRKRRPSGAFGDEPAPAGPDGLDRVETVRLLQALPRRQREVVALRYLADLPVEAVARELGCSVGTVKQHAHRGLAALRVSVTADDDEDEEGHRVRLAR
jgi:DNA-directed RNA polymerase specialized sigma24 family protein